MWLWKPSWLKKMWCFCYVSVVACMACGQWEATSWFSWRSSEAFAADSSVGGLFFTMPVLLRVKQIFVGVAMLLSRLCKVNVTAHHSWKLDDVVCFRLWMNGCYGCFNTKTTIEALAFLNCSICELGCLPKRCRWDIDIAMSHSALWSSERERDDVRIPRKLTNLLQVRIYQHLAISYIRTLNHIPLPNIRARKWATLPFSGRTH